MTDQRLVLGVATMLGLALMAAAVTMATEEPIRPIEAAQLTPSRQGAVALRAEGLTNKELRTRFKKLSDQDIIEVKGRRVTKAQFLGEIGKRSQLARARVKGENAAQSQAKFEALRSQFEAQQKSALEANNAQTRVGFARLAQQWGPGAASQAVRMRPSSEREIMRREAAELMRRSGAASPAEQAGIEKRAQQLLQRAKQIGR
jgi:hypothetical protein